MSSSAMGTTPSDSRPAEERQRGGDGSTPPSPSTAEEREEDVEDRRNGAEATEEEEEEDRTPPRPRRQAQLRYLTARDESPSDSDRAPKRRGRPPKSGNKTSKGKESPPTSEEKPKRQQRGRGRPPSGGGGGGGETSDSAADYVPVEVGDCVLLDSGDADDHYVALVSSVQLSQSSEKPTGFTAQWYYKPDDIRDDVRETIAGGVLPNEVFLSPHKDKNSIDAVIGLCNVVPPEEYVEVMSEIERGFREKGNKPYYVCRFKYYPSRSVKKALEPLKDEDIRGGLGPQKPKVGEDHQATIPDLQSTKPVRPAVEQIPWRQNAPSGPDQSVQVWSRHVVSTQEQVFRQFRSLLDTIRFGVGNVVRVYRVGKTFQGHVRCIVIKSAPSEAVEVCMSTGEVKATIKGELCSTLSEDVAMKILYASRFNLTLAAFKCSQQLVETQRRERDAFKQEVLTHAQVAAVEKARQAAAAAAEETSNRKRRK